MDATDALDLVSDPRRAEILQALVDRSRESPADATLSFSDLHDRTGIDDSGQFNYHLGKLVGTFVERVDGGYRLTNLGVRALATLVGGTYDVETTLGPEPVEDCPHCDGSLVMRYERGMLGVACEDGHAGLQAMAPSRSVVERDVEGRIELLALDARSQVTLVRAGVCPNCHHDPGLRHVPVDDDGDPVEPPGAERDGSTDAGTTDPAEPAGHLFALLCDRCGTNVTVSPGMLAAEHPAVVSFLHERGRDVTATPYWRLRFCDPDAPTRTGEDPLRLSLEVAADGDVLALTFDGDGRVLDATDA